MAYYAPFNNAAGAGQAAVPQSRGILGGQGRGIFGGGAGGFGQLLDPQVALPVAAALIAGPTFQEGLAGAFKAAAPGLAQAKKRQAWNAWLKAGAPKDPNDPTLQALLAESPDLGEKMALMKLGVGGGSGYGDTPIYLNKIGPDGKPIGGLSVGRFNDQGGVTVATPEGYQVADPMTYLNAGGQFVPAGRRTGTEGAAAAGAAPVPIDTEAPARGAAIGKGQGEAVVTAKSMRAKLPGLQNVVAELGDLGDKATYTEGGKIYDYARRQLNLEPRESAVARTKYMSMVDNQVLPLLRDTFGAQFTEREGATLRATLGAPDVSPQEKRAVLNAFIKQKIRDIQAMEQQAGVVPASPPTPGLEIGGPPADLGNGVTIERVE